MPALALLVASVASFLVAVAYSSWVGEHNMRYYAAVEVGELPVYEPGHLVMGTVLGAILAVGLAAAATAVLALVTPKASRRITRVLVPLIALAAGVAAVIGMLSPLYAVAPAFVGAVLAIILGVRGASTARHTSAIK